MTTQLTGDLTVTEVPANAPPVTDHPELPTPPPAPELLPALTWAEQAPPPPAPTPTPIQTAPQVQP